MTEPTGPTEKTELTGRSGLSGLTDPSGPTGQAVSHKRALDLTQTSDTLLQQGTEGALPRVVVFVGPSLDRGEVVARLSNICELEIHSPAGQGDLADAVVGGRTPKVIALIDGVYEHEPAIWHKEVLWALSKGIWVVGGASMGALRGAETYSFGMVAVGWVAEQFITGALVADEEVAVAHLNADYEWRAVSEALVSIRVTISDALASSILSDEQAANVLGIAQQLAYPDRTWANVVHAARPTVNAVDLDRFATWLVANQRNIKSEDARLVLDVVAQKITDSDCFVPSFAFAATNQWLNAAPKPTDGCDPQLRNDLHDELRLNGEWVELLQSALLRVMAQRLFPVNDPEALASWVEALNARLNPDERYGLSDEAITGLASRQAALHEAWAVLGSEAVDAVNGVLRIRAEYGEARAKADTIYLANTLLGAPEGELDPRIGGVTEAEVVAELKRIVGMHLAGFDLAALTVDQLETCAVHLGFDDANGLRRGVVRRLLAGIHPVV